MQPAYLRATKAITGATAKSTAIVVTGRPGIIDITSGRIKAEALSNIARSGPATTTPLFTTMSSVPASQTAPGAMMMEAGAEAREKKDITIIGGGIIGCTTAYYLTRHPAYDRALHRITLLEASSSSSAGGRTRDSILSDPATLTYPEVDSSSNNNNNTNNNNGNATITGNSPPPQQQQQQIFNSAHDGIASGASGKAGGLLAKWAYPSNIVPLSFRLHDELAREHGGARRWGYRRCWASQVECRARLPRLAGGGDGSGDVGAGEAEEHKASRRSSENADGNTKGLHKDHKKSAAALDRLGVPADLDWLDDDDGSGGGGLEGYENMGTPDDTAQVHPELFTRSMAALAEERGVRIVTGARVTRIDGDGGAVQSVTYHVAHKTGAADDQQDEQVTLPSTDVVVAAGPWTSRILPRGPPVTATRAHSIVIRPPQPVSAYALFTAITLPPGFPAPTEATSEDGGGGGGGGGVAGQKNENKDSALRLLDRPTTVEPEIYARPDGTAYACGPTDTDVDLPLLASDVSVDESRCDDIAAQVGAISDVLAAGGSGGGAREYKEGSRRGAEILAKQACYLPQGGPWIGAVPGQPRGVVVAAGHTCWGIQNAPATGLLVSEIVLEGGARSARLGGCDPARVMAGGGGRT
ncbi:FAD-dependent oxidoreductase [Microdochium nivale]|nr:FAD-dependent oxidoreductase [Microdochium nivale]